ncbi:hypothetical protein [Marinifilum fragile]|uniref:hypothetical protein n=1 Tax=Marinifilum fragile TaxID=570161 RepID=UPI002AA92950|nr:hypothetical protein [Marinifilum fragile]
MLLLKKTLTSSDITETNKEDKVVFKVGTVTDTSAYTEIKFTTSRGIGKPKAVNEVFDFSDF